MSTPPGNNPNESSTRGSPSGNRTERRLLTRAEAVALLGMVVCIASLFLAWPVPVIAKLPVPALVINLTRTGAAMDDVRWPITVGAILSGLLLAFTPTPASRMPLAAVQVLCGLVCFVVALTHFGMHPGPILALAGGTLLTLGAVDRLSQPVSAE